MTIPNIFVSGPEFFNDLIPFLAEKERRRPLWREGMRHAAVGLAVRVTLVHEAGCAAEACSSERIFCREGERRTRGQGNHGEQDET